jgi:anthranilate phosphoribosyltransferase
LSDVVCANAACALVVAGFAKDAMEGFALARASVESGAALDKLEQLRLLGRETARVLA